MKQLLLFLLLPLLSLTQTLYKFDYVENFDADWSGVWWIPAATTGYYTNAFVSSNSSAVIYGLGSGTSVYESDWYSFPNLVVNSSYDYQFKFRLGSYRFTSTATTRGVDAADYVTVQLSTNGGVSYVNELRITGNANAFWDYNAAAYTKTANGTLTTIGPAAGGNRTATGDGYSVIQLNIPAGTTQIAIDIFARANSAGEEWWMDNFELTRIGGPLPVELLYFDVDAYPKYNLLTWATASEKDASHFIIERSMDAENWIKVGNKSAAGNSAELQNYSYQDAITESAIHYYRLIQYDIDGAYEIYGPVVIDNTRRLKKIIKYVDLMGREVTPEAQGIIFEIYEDGTSKKIIR